jgi:hypothetical protein
LIDPAGGVDVPLVRMRKTLQMQMS